MSPHVILARRAAVGLAAQLAQGNHDEYELLCRMYLEEAHRMGIDQVKAFALLAHAGLNLAVIGQGQEPEWFMNTAIILAGQS